MSGLELKIGNRMVFDYCLTIDGDLLGKGDAVEFSLQDITAGYWMVKNKATDANEDALVVVKFDPSTGAANEDFLRDTPETGWLRVIVKPSKSVGIEPGVYPFALQLEWGPENKQEFSFGDGTIKLCQDVIR